VLPEAEFAEAVARQAAGLQAASSSRPAEADVGDPAFAERLAAMGKETAAIAELLKGYREGDPSLDDRIATLYAGGGDLDAAEKYWRKNYDRADPWSTRAVVGLARIATARRDVPAWLAIHRRLLAVSGMPIGDVLVDGAAMARELGEVGLGLDLLREYARRYPNGARMDEAAWHSAQLLELDTRFRDLKRARELYAALLRDFPESPFAAGALERVRWLDQHVFLVR
jgi:tetratricopeptide (TPR) repeat protein